MLDQICAVGSLLADEIRTLWAIIWKTGLSKSRNPFIVMGFWKKINFIQTIVVASVVRVREGLSFLKIGTT